MHFWALYGLLRIWNSWSQMIESNFIDRIDTIYIVSHLLMFVTDSFSTTRNSTTVLCLKCNHYTIPFWWPPVHMQENVLFYSAVTRRTSKINHRKICIQFLLILTSIESFAHIFLATLILYTSIQKYLYINNPYIKLFSLFSSCYIQWKFSSSGIWHCIIGCTALDILKDLTKCW